MNLYKYIRQPISLDGPSVTCNLAISIDHWCRCTLSFSLDWN